MFLRPRPCALLRLPPIGIATRAQPPGIGHRRLIMVDILTAVLIDGLPAVEAACAEALAEGVHSADVILNILARQRPRSAI